jgi:hypothetical protein
MWSHVELVWTDVSEEGIASIFRVEKSASEEPAWAGQQPPANADSSLADFCTLKTEAIPSFETSVHTRCTRRHIPEDSILHSHRREKLKFYIENTTFQKLDLFPSSSEGRDTYTVWSLRKN